MHTCTFDSSSDPCVICGNHVLITVKATCIINNVIFISRTTSCISNVHFKAIFSRHNSVKMILDML